MSLTNKVSSSSSTFDLFAAGMNAIIKQYIECTAAPYITSAVRRMLREPQVYEYANRQTENIQYDGE